jgi:uncharacterized membrane protein YdjX (TVP38/TMEM64 family)
MQELFNQITTFFIDTLTELGPLFGVFTIILESVFPILPLAVFLSFNAIAFGPILGFIINWVSTCLGCFLSFFTFKKGFGNRLDRKMKDDSKVRETLAYIKKISFPSLVLLMALPFTPAFAINIASGLSNMDTKKFVLAVLISKPSIIFFWSYVGMTLIKSDGDIWKILQMLLIVLLSYLISLIIQDKIKEK